MNIEVEGDIQRLPDTKVHVLIMCLSTQLCIGTMFLEQCCFSQLDGSMELETEGGAQKS